MIIKLGYFDSIQQGANTKNHWNNFKQHLKPLLFYAYFDSFIQITSKSRMIKYSKYQTDRLRAQIFHTQFLVKGQRKMWVVFQCVRAHVCLCGGIYSHLTFVFLCFPKSLYVHSRRTGWLRTQASDGDIWASYLTSLSLTLELLL